MKYNCHYLCLVMHHKLILNHHIKVFITVIIAWGHIIIEKNIIHLLMDIIVTNCILMITFATNLVLIMVIMKYTTH